MTPVVLLGAFMVVALFPDAHLPICGGPDVDEEEEK